MTGFHNLFWGFLFILLDFRLNGLDIIPDLVGYLLISQGLGKLATWNSHFNEAKKFAFPLTILSIFDLYQVNRPLNEFTLNPMVILFVFLGIVIAIIDLYMVYHICGGTAELASEVGDLELQSNALVRWKYYLYAKIAFIIWSIFTFLSPHIMVVLGVPLLILTLIIAFLIMMLMGQADRSFTKE